jgi:hypothetical protein
MVLPTICDHTPLVQVNATTGVVDDEVAVDDRVRGAGEMNPIAPASHGEAGGGDDSAPDMNTVGAWSDGGRTRMLNRCLALARECNAHDIRRDEHAFLARAADHERVTGCERADCLRNNAPASQSMETVAASSVEPPTDIAKHIMTADIRMVIDVGSLSGPDGRNRGESTTPSYERPAD